MRNVVTNNTGVTLGIGSTWQRFQCIMSREFDGSSFLELDSGPIDYRPNTHDFCLLGASRVQHQIVLKTYYRSNLRTISRLWLPMYECYSLIPQRNAVVSGFGFKSPAHFASDSSFKS